MDENISQFDWPPGDTSCHGKQISVHTRDLDPETDLCKLVQQICPWSLLPHIKPVGTELGSKSFVAQHIFSLEIVGADEGALLRERVAGAYCGSKLPRVYRPLACAQMQQGQCDGCRRGIRGRDVDPSYQ